MLLALPPRLGNLSRYSHAPASQFSWTSTSYRNSGSKKKDMVVSWLFFLFIRDNADDPWLTMDDNRRCTFSGRRILIVKPIVPPCWALSESDAAWPDDSRVHCQNGWLGLVVYYAHQCVTRVWFFFILISLPPGARSFLPLFFIIYSWCLELSSLILHNANGLHSHNLNKTFSLSKSSNM